MKWDVKGARLLMGKAGNYSFLLKFKEVNLPPFKDILVLAKNCPQGKLSVERSLELLQPNGFERVDVENPVIDAVFLSKRLLVKITSEKILKMLDEHVFPYVSEGEAVKVDLKLVSKKMVP